GLGTIAAVAIGNGAAAVNIFVQNRLGARTEARLASTLFAGYLRQPYAFHVQRDAPSLLKVLEEGVYIVVGGAVVPMAVLVSRSALAAGILVLLVLRDPTIALTVGAVLITAYGIVYRFARTRQLTIGREANHQGERRTRIAHEGFGGVKELQVLGRLGHAAASYRDAVRRNAHARALAQTAAQLPRYLLETLAFGGILLVTIAQVGVSAEGAAAAVPTLALYAFAGYRLMPALQQVFTSVMNIRFARPALLALHADYMRIAAADESADATEPDGRPTVELHETLSLDRVTFTYPGAPRPALADVSLTIRRGDSLGLVGRTGSGKTTLADLILGLYRPDSGAIRVDGVELTGKAVTRWRQRVGYVPQSVFLANASVGENIAFGLPAHTVDRAAVERAARLAQADEFIAGLPQGFDTIVGERGVRLSGGQRQRIGIARALYHQPDILVFDEATSALDGLTEDAVIDAIRSLARERTIVVIAHRLRTVEACSRIVVLQQGRVAAQGHYEELAATSPVFRDLMGRSAVTANVGA
ncbi:MAG: ABC transporter ATP-binding protein, partial [Acidimicrobiia bacterium]|nr:ABC transporter ATP-binding protein [Acidimicrobiia bacterium]